MVEVHLRFWEMATHGMICTANSRVHRLLTFDTRGLFSLDSRGISVLGAMSTFHVHIRCWDKSSACLLSTRPSATR